MLNKFKIYLKGGTRIKLAKNPFFFQGEGWGGTLFFGVSGRGGIIYWELGTVKRARGGFFLVL